VLAASQCPTSRDFVPWRFLVAGRFSVPSRPHPGDQKPAQELTLHRSKCIAISTALARADRNRGV